MHNNHKATFKIMNKNAKETLKQFPEVKWDRFTIFVDEVEMVRVFGWIIRKDGQRDFLVIDFIDGEVDNYCTSSAKYSKKFSERLGFDHIDCIKVAQI